MAKKKSSSSGKSSGKPSGKSKPKSKNQSGSKKKFQNKTKKKGLRALVKGQENISKNNKKALSKEDSSENSEKSSKSKKSYQGRGRRRSNDGPKTKLTGTVKRHPDGFGFFIPESDHADVFLPPPEMRGIMSKDKVEIIAISRGKENRFYGKVEKILERKTKDIVGKFELNENKDMGIIKDQSGSWGADLKILVHNSRGAKSGLLVKAEIVSYPGPHGDFFGKIIEIIGDAQDPLNDVKRAIAEHQVPEGFSKNAIKVAQDLGHEVKDIHKKDRVDLRNKNFVTIDGATAKDFDDAIYIESHGSGFKLWVAIADVSFYIDPNTSLNDEAYEKGTSTYFPGFVVPMLPEEISNGLCSLNPNVDRLAFTCEMDIDFNGHVTKSRFYESVIESKMRLTYGLAQSVIDEQESTKNKEIDDLLFLAENLAKILLAKRIKEGTLDLNISESQVMLGPDGVPVDIIKTERIFANRLIEEFMLATNVEAARFFKDNEMEGVFRIHESPNQEDIGKLSEFLYSFGGKIKLSGGGLQKKLTNALQDFAGRPEETILNILTLRSMSQAKYSSNNVGHFGLGFDDYSHFTSPIRRFPDLMVHRLIKSRLYKNNPKYKIDENILEGQCQFLSSCEQRSVKAERLLVSIKKARFMNQYLGDAFTGKISSVTKFGFFVMLDEFDVDGLCHLEKLGKDYFIYDEERLTLKAKRSGYMYCIGDAVTIIVDSANIDDGKIDFSIKEHSQKNQEEESSDPESSSE